MFHNASIVSFVSLFSLLNFGAPIAVAQRVRIGSYGGIRIQAPLVDIQIPGRMNYQPFYGKKFYNYGYGRNYYSTKPRYRSSYRSRLPATQYQIPATQHQTLVPQYPSPTTDSRSNSPIVTRNTNTNPYYPSIVSNSTIGTTTPTYDQTGAGSIIASSETLQQSATRLDRALSQRTNGDIWQNYLQPAKIAKLASKSDLIPQDWTVLRTLKGNYDGTVANPQLRWVTQLPGFASTHRLIGQRLARQSSSESQPVANTDSSKSILDSSESGKPSGEPETIKAPQPEELPVPEPQQPEDNGPSKNRPKQRQYKI